MMTMIDTTTTGNDSMTTTSTTTMTIWWSMFDSTMFSLFHPTAYMYGFVQIVVLLTLIAITIYRKEMSCNRCYSSVESSASPPQSLSSSSSSSQPATTTTTTTPKSQRIASHPSSSSSSSSATMTLPDNVLDELETETLLEEAGCYGSGTYTLFWKTLRLLQRLVWCDSNRNTKKMYYYYCYYSHPLLLVFHHMCDSIVLWWNVAAEERRLEDILDGAENWCVLGPQPSVIVSSILDNNNNNTQLTVSNSISGTHVARVPVSDTSGVFPASTASQRLPNDVLVHIFSYLHPQDIISFSCTNHTAHNALLLCPPQEDDDHNSVNPKDNRLRSELSYAVWKTLWYRDYGWLMTHWEVGRMALERSFLQYDGRSGDDSSTAVPTFTGNTTMKNHHTLLLDTIIPYSAQFYFRFGLSYVNYIIAGHCNRHQCYIGLGGHIYNITNFVDQHPGSSETLLVHSGRDVSSIFETMRHTISARMMAEQFCVVVDASLLSDGLVGARPTSHSFLLSPVDTGMKTYHSMIAPILPPAVSHRCHSNQPIPSTLEYLYDIFLEEQEIYEHRAKIRLSALSSAGTVVVGDIHVYYDPLIDEWKGWYMNTNFESVFIDL